MFEIENKEFEKEEYFDYFTKPIDQVNYMLLKKPILYSQLKEIKEEERSKYFWIKKAQSLEVTKKIQKELAKSIKKGESFYYFQERLEKEGIYSNKDRAYWESAYNQNVTMAQSMSNFKEMQKMKDEGFKYARYSAILDGRETMICHNLHGKVMTIDEWEAQNLIPPVHYGCRSTLVQLSDREVENEKGELRKHIKTVSNEELAHLKKHKQKGFGVGISYEEMLQKYVEDKEKKVYNELKELKVEYKEYSKELEDKLQKDSDEFFNKLNTNEKDVLNDYTDTLYTKMNLELLNLKYEYDEQYSNPDKIREKIKNLNKLFDKFKLKENCITYRITDKNFFTHYKVGEVYETKIFTSTALMEEQTELFYNDLIGDFKTPIKLKIKVPKGSRAIYIGKNSSVSDETELLLAPGVKWKVISIKDDLIELEVIK